MQLKSLFTPRTDRRPGINEIAAIRAQQRRWPIYWGDRYVGLITDGSSKWAHEDYTISYAQTEVMTAENRKYLDILLNKLIREIKAAKSERRADYVSINVDPRLIDVGTVNQPKPIQAPKAAPKTPKMARHAKFGEGEVIYRERGVATVQFANDVVKRIRDEYLEFL